MPLSAEEIRKLQAKARQLRCDMVDVTVWAGGAHIGGSLSMADVLTALYYQYLNIEPEEPDWQERDRFVLSKGHGGVGLAVRARRQGLLRQGAPARSSTTSRAPFGMHLDGNKVPGVDASTGSLGHGLSMARGHGAGRQVPEAGLAHLLHPRRRRVRRGLRLGGGHGRRPLQARQPHRLRRPQPHDDRRPHRGHHEPRAAGRQVDAPSAGRCARSTATTSPRSARPSRAPRRRRARPP